LAPQFNAQRILPSVEVPQSLVVQADRTMLRRALMNLVLNAVDVMPGGGDLVITATATMSGATDLEVADSGPGIPEEIRRRMFEPFFTTKSQGTGLGLAIVNRIAEAHGGEVQVANCPEGGAAFTLRIPNRSSDKEAA
jgi:signal transduction histidine kinase